MSHMDTTIQSVSESKPKFLYRRVAEAVIDDIQSGRYAQGDRLPVESELQKRFKVSRIVIRQAMELLGQKKLIERQPGKGTFVREPIAAQGHAMIGVLNGYRMGASDPCFAPMLDAVSNALSASDKSVVLRNIYNVKPAELDDMVRFVQLDGILILMPDIVESAQMVAKRVSKLGVPVVGVNFRSNLIDCVFQDCYSGGFCVAEHLMELGHRKIWCLDFENSPVGVAERMEGFSDAISQNSWDASLDKITTSHDDVYRMICDSVSSGQELPTAIFAADDQMAAKVITALTRYDLRVPEDISVVGYNDIHLTESHIPPLTTVHVPLREMATYAVRLLNKKLASGEQEPTGKQTMLMPKLVVRDSSAIVKD